MPYIVKTFWLQVLDAFQLSIDIRDNINDINVLFGGAAGHKKDILNCLFSLVKKYVYNTKCNEKSLNIQGFYPTALIGYRSIVFTHGVQIGGTREKVCRGGISETARCRKLILGRDIG